MIRVFLVDDHDMVRFGFRSFLSNQTDIDVVGDAASAEEALTQLKRQPVDVLVCDLHLPGMSGLEVTERLVRSESPTRVIVVSAQLDGPLPKRVMDAGAAGYLSKHCGPDELVRAVRDVSRGKRYLAAEIAQQWALEWRWWRIAIRRAHCQGNGSGPDVDQGRAVRGHCQTSEPE